MDKEDIYYIILYTIVALAIMIGILAFAFAQPIQLSDIEIDVDRAWIIGEPQIIQVSTFNSTGELSEVEDIEIELITDISHEKDEITRLSVGVYQREFIINNKTEEFVEFNITAIEREKIINRIINVTLEEQSFVDQKAEQIEDRLAFLVDPIREHPLIVMSVVILVIVILFFIELVTSNRAMEK